MIAGILGALSIAAGLAVAVLCIVISGLASYPVSGLEAHGRALLFGGPFVALGVVLLIWG